MQQAQFIIIYCQYTRCIPIALICEYLTLLNSLLLYNDNKVESNITSSNPNIKYEQLLLLIFFFVFVLLYF